MELLERHQRLPQFCNHNRHMIDCEKGLIVIEIERMRRIAGDAIQAYHDETELGGEPVYPHWADDILAVCKQAEHRLNSRPRFSMIQKNRCFA